MSEQMPFGIQEVPPTQWPLADTPPVRVLIVGPYLVQVYEEANQMLRLSVNSVQRKGRSWADRIPWEHLQHIKERVGYGDRDAVEVYPAEGDIVNVANMRHLWVMPEPLSYVWRSS